MGNKISISSCFDYDILLEEQMRLISNLGFTHISLGSNINHSRIFDEKRVDEINYMLKQNNLKIDTIHFSQNLLSHGWENIMIKTMKIANNLECPVIVAHCTSFMAKEIIDDSDIDKLKDNINRLEYLCNKYNIRVALENLCCGKPTDILEQLLEYSDNSEYIGFCYDSSHDQIDGPRAMNLLNKWKHKLYAIHISDRIKEFTDHVTLGEGFINFNEMTDILSSIDFDIPLTLEIMKTHSSLKNTDEFLNKAYNDALNLITQINNKKA